MQNSITLLNYLSDFGRPLVEHPTYILPSLILTTLHPILSFLIFKPLNKYPIPPKSSKMRSAAVVAHLAGAAAAIPGVQQPDYYSEEPEVGHSWKLDSYVAHA